MITDQNTIDILRLATDKNGMLRNNKNFDRERARKELNEWERDVKEHPERHPNAKRFRIPFQK